MKHVDLKIIVDEMLRPHGVGYDYVTENPKIKGLPWYDYYTTTPDREAEFKEWCINHIRGLRCSKKDASEWYQWFHLFYGLRIIRDK